MADEEVPLEPAKRVEATAPLQARVALSGKQLKQMAVNGGFAVDETTGDRMIQSLEGILDSLSARWSALQKVGERPPMSSTATAQWVSGHMVNTASDEQGLLTQLQAARDEFPTYIEAIKQAKRNYRERDDGTKRTIKQLSPEEA